MFHIEDDYNNYDLREISMMTHICNDIYELNAYPVHIMLYQLLKKIYSIY